MSDPRERKPIDQARTDTGWIPPGEVGDETGDASSPRPDENVADEIGEEVGVTYPNDQELRTGEEWERRDRHRWELNPSSSDEDPQTRRREAEEDAASPPRDASRPTRRATEPESHQR